MSGIVEEGEHELVLVVPHQRHRVGRAVARLRERVLLDVRDRLGPRENVTGRVVRERDVDRVRNRDDLKCQQKDRSRNQELERERPTPGEIDGVDRRRHECEQPKRSPLVMVGQDDGRPDRERIDQAEQDDLDHEPDRAREGADQPGRE